MNKKFSTLVASVLLAGAVGTVNAAVGYNSYVKSAGLAVNSVETIADGKAYQISDGTDVLVMEEQANGTMQLKMVTPTSADLLSSLWTIETANDGEGGISFAFINKATGLPLAFSTEGVKENETTANALGNVSLWKWRGGVSDNKAATLISSFAKDSAMVLLEDGDVISAKKVYTGKGLPTSNFEVNAYEANAVVLTANALNSMLGLQDPKTGKMKLGFTRDQLNGSDNLWLKDMKAVQSTFDSPSKHGSIPVYYTQPEIDAANAIKGLVANLDKPAQVTEILNTIGAGYTADKQAVLLDILSAVSASTGATFNSAAEVVANKLSFYENANKVAVAQAQLANDINEKVADFPGDATIACGDLDAYNGNLGKDKFGKELTGVDEPSNATNIVNALKAVVPIEFSLADVKRQTATLAGIFASINNAVKDLGDDAIDTKDEYDAIVNEVIDNGTDNVSIRTSLKTAANATDEGGGSVTPLTVKANAEKMAQYASAVSEAAQTFEATANAPISDGDAWTAAIAALKNDLPIANYSDLDKAAYDIVFADLSATWSVDLTESKAAVATAKDEYDAAKTSPNDKYDAANELNDAVVAKNVAITVQSAITDAKPAEGDEVIAVYDAIIEAAAGDNVAEAVAAALTKAESYNGVKEWEGTEDNSYLSLITKANTDAAKVEYLRVDTAFLTKDAGKKHLAFATGVYKAELKGSDKNPVDPAVQADYNGRYNFKFTYFPTQDSLMIKADGFAHPRTDKYYADMSASEINESRALHAADNNVKLAVLSTDKHHEVTLGDIETIETSKLPTINTRIYLNGSANYERTTLASGVYFFSLVTEDADKMDDNGKYRVAQYCGDQVVYEAIESTQRFGTAQDFNHMPRTQWVVEQNEGVIGEQTVNIVNREFPAKRYTNVQLYKAGDDVFSQISGFAIGDTLAYAKVADQYTTDKYLGYKKFVKAEDYEKFYNLDYLSGIELGNYVNFNADSAVYVDLKDGKTFIEFVPVTVDTEFGYASTKAKATQLYKAAYQLRVHSETLLTTGDYYVTVGKDGKSYVVTSSTSGIEPSNFVLKENNELISEEGDTTCYYALQQVNLRQDEEDEDVYYVASELQRVGVRDASMAFTAENSCYNAAEKRIATFAVVNDKTPLYRRLGETLENDGFQDMTVQNAKVYTVNSAAKEYLYEDAYSKYSKDLGINFLGLEDKGVTAKSAMFVDTAYVRGNTNMPQYMFVMNPQIVKADTIWCNATSTHKHATLADSLACPHTTITPASVTGRYLINAQDSVNAGDKNYVWNSKYTRLAFVDAKHIGDTLVIFRNGKPSTAKADSIFLGNNNHNKDNAKNPVFALRLVNTDACDFLIETAGDHKIPSDGTGKWVAIKNGVPVVAAYETYKDAIRDAEIFNIEPTEEIATSNDAITAGEVSVVAGDAKVIIKGAAGKKVAISNLLGQTIANTVITSDNAEIAAPAGVVVVAIEGESAVKAIVK